MRILTTDGHIFDKDKATLILGVNGGYQEYYKTEFGTLICYQEEPFPTAKEISDSTMLEAIQQYIDGAKAYNALVALGWDKDIETI